MTAKIRYERRHYLTPQAWGKKDEVLQVLEKITARLEILYEKELIFKYLLRVLYNNAVILDEILEPEDVLIFSDGHLPIIFCSISFDFAKQEASQVALAAFEAEFEMEVFKVFAIVD